MCKSTIPTSIASVVKRGVPRVGKNNTRLRRKEESESVNHKDPDESTWVQIKGLIRVLVPVSKPEL